MIANSKSHRFLQVEPKLVQLFTHVCLHPTLYEVSG